mgnify:FL=1
MIKDSKYERVYTGSEINVNHLKSQLEDAGISSVVRNDHESAIRAGFGSDYDRGVLLFVEKDNLLRAKHIIEKTTSEPKFTDAELEEQATQSRLKEQTTERKGERPLIQKEEKPKRSFFNLALNAGLLIYSLWRLYPLTQGEELPTYRILLSSLIAVFCGYTLVRHFIKK